MTTRNGLPVISSDDLSYEPDARYHYNGQWFSGWALTAEDPRATEEQEFRDGFRWGPARVHLASGLLIQEVHFRMDLKHGRERMWYRTDQLRYEAEHEHGILISEKEWDENGVLTKEFNRPNVDADLAEMRSLYGTPEQVAEEEAAYRARFPADGP